MKPITWHKWWILNWSIWPYPASRWFQIVKDSDGTESGFPGLVVDAGRLRLVFSRQR